MGGGCTGEMGRVINSPWVDHDFSAFSPENLCPRNPLNLRQVPGWLVNLMCVGCVPWRTVETTD